MASKPASLRDDPVWKDVTPLPEPPNSEHLVKINATPTFTEIMAYFRAIISRDELSERALDLTLLVIGVNSSNYTAWHYRRRCLVALKKNPEDELTFVGTSQLLDTHLAICISRTGSPHRCACIPAS